MTKKNIARLLVVLSILAAAWWMFYFPYSRARLFRPIPINVSYVSEHHNLAGTWKDSVGNPVVVNVMKSVLGDIDMEKVAADKRAMRLMRLLASKNTIFAHVPSFKYSGRPAWIITSWVSGDSKLVRSGVLEKAIPGIKEKTFEGGKKGWWLRLDDKSPYGVMSMTVEEGLLIVCFSSAAEDLDYLLAISERGNAVTTILSKNLTRFKTDNRGWVNLMNYGIRSISSTELYFSVSSINSAALSGWVGMDVGFNGDTRPLVEDEFREVMDLTHQSMEVLAIVPLLNLSSFVAGLKPANGFRKIVAQLDGLADPNGSVFVGIRSRKDEGRAMSLAAPSLVIGCRMKEGANVLDAVPAVIDGVNAGFKTTFKPRGTSMGETPVVAVESSSTDTFRGFDKNQKPVFIASGRWLLMGSNMVVLERLFGEDQFAVDVNLPEGQEKNVLIGAWADVPLMNDSLRDKALPILSLMFSVENTSSGRKKRRRVDTMDYFASLLDGTDACRLWLRQDDDMVRLNFELKNNN